ncbi:putative pentatricopeptide repeat-containing protein At3g01580 [Selaginella moellendorffii]|uniref:putative pentatricopeptide repeat-containing protein At3g01580 n=1 Tax=Selaginella moellendorffii TaxID=88036 RepID=UPI000D1CED57|nr:putative pentatricopeptide repeat-containing protein At3g01580 [Selaginella moellendorffii]XP_024535641.1 putative pentatricopeptide repeat-containing protein At3g01580 [Selaginella moellendorffii]|eukprot:XP_024535640.1 putative pentatricopeptide repeat-containing protein At3g01580 [Selaginella moellendorffii]
MYRLTCRTRVYKQKLSSRCSSSLPFANAPENQKVTVDACSLMAALKACGRSKDIKGGQEIHATVLKSGLFPWNTSLGNSLVNMYAKCGNMPEAHKVFHQMPVHSVISWNTLIAGYAVNGECEVALQLFEDMRREGSEPNARTYLPALMACSSWATKEEAMQVGGKLVKMGCLQKGMAIHSQALANNYRSDVFIGSMLVTTYAKCGSMVDARMAFDKMPSPDLVAWNALLQGYVDNGESELALDLFSVMASLELEADTRTFVAALMACGNLADKEEGKRLNGKLVKGGSMERGKEVHVQASTSGCCSNLFVSCSLIDMYVKCGSLKDAFAVFESMPRHDVVSWTALILGYAESNEAEVALELFERMKDEGCLPDSRTFVAVMVACGNLAGHQNNQQVMLEVGRKLHTEAAKQGFSSHLRVANTMVDMYAKCGSLEESRRVFEQMAQRDVVSWNVIILGCLVNGDAEMAWKLFERMQGEGCTPNGGTFVAAAMACGRLAGKVEGERINGRVVKVEWLQKATDIYSQAKKGGFDVHVFVASALVEMFGKCGSMISARAVFEKMTFHDLVAWNGLIVGYAGNGEAELALAAYQQMREEGRFVPNSRTCVALLMACGELAALEEGTAIYAEICRNGLEDEEFVATGLVDFYGKCGSTSKARRAFNSMKNTDSVTWTALLAGYSSAGDTEQALQFFQEMVAKEDGGVDGVALLCVLSACSRAGLVEKGKRLFRRMASGEFGIQPGIEHYHCFIDMLGRANMVQDATEAAKRMPFPATAVTWTTILGACLKWKDLEMGKVAFDKFLETDTQHPAAYSLMANLYGSAGMWQEQKKVLELTRKRHC